MSRYPLARGREPGPRLEQVGERLALLDGVPSSDTSADEAPEPEEAPTEGEAPAEAAAAAASEDPAAEGS